MTHEHKSQYFLGHPVYSVFTLNFLLQCRRNPEHIFPEEIRVYFLKNTYKNTSKFKDTSTSSALFIFHGDKSEMTDDPVKLYQE